MGTCVPTTLDWEGMRSSLELQWAGIWRPALLGLVALAKTSSMRSSTVMPIVRTTPMSR